MNKVEKHLIDKHTVIGLFKYLRRIKNKIEDLEFSIEEVKETDIGAISYNERFGGGNASSPVETRSIKLRELILKLEEEQERLKQAKKKVSKLCEKLTDDERKAVELKFYKGMTYSQVAEVLGKSYRQAIRYADRGLEKISNACMSRLQVL